MAKRSKPAPFSENAFRKAYVAPGIHLVTGTVQEWVSPETVLARRKRRVTTNRLPAYLKARMNLPPRTLDPDQLTKPLGLMGEWAIYGIASPEAIELLTDATLDARAKAECFTVLLQPRMTILHLLRLAAEEYWERFPNGDDNHIYFELVSIDREHRWIIFHMGS